jgi:hypothetical protein
MQPIRLVLAVCAVLVAVVAAAGTVSAAPVPAPRYSAEVDTARFSDDVLAAISTSPPSSVTRSAVISSPWPPRKPRTPPERPPLVPTRNDRRTLTRPHRASPGPSRRRLPLRGIPRKVPGRAAGRRTERTSSSAARREAPPTRSIKTICPAPGRTAATKSRRARGRRRVATSAGSPEAPPAHKLGARHASHCRRGRAVDASSSVPPESWRRAGRRAVTTLDGTLERATGVYRPGAGGRGCTPRLDRRGAPRGRPTRGARTR